MAKAIRVGRGVLGRHPSSMALLAMASLVVSAMACSSSAKDGASSCLDLQRACLGAGKCLESRSAGTSCATAPDGGPSTVVTDEGTCDFSCVLCTTTTTTPAADDAGAASADGGDAGPDSGHGGTSTEPPAGSDPRPGIIGECATNASRSECIACVATGVVSWSGGHEPAGRECLRV